MIRNTLATLCLALVLAGGAFASCTQPQNAIEAENCLPGTPQSSWYVSGSGDSTIQGFTTDISVNAGQTISFKIKTSATGYRLDIYRMGYYGGDGARFIATVQPSAKLPQSQPICLNDSTTNLVDCGNWAISASWAVPASAVSGIYFANLVRSDTGGSSQVVFVVRNDASHSDVLFQTSDESWQAYNPYGGHSFYGNTTWNLTDRAYKVSYNRPFNTPSLETVTWVFAAEYPMVRWLEANGYDATYFTSVDTARNGSLITNHKVFLSVGHDEYWSGPKRASVEAARATGVNLAFFSGNEVFWKTRWENSIDGSGTPYRTLVCYKETLGPNSTPTATAAVDPLDPPIWTGTWRDPTKSPPSDGGRPENALTGTLFRVNGPGSDNTNLAIKIPAADGRMRFWRGTPVASQSAGQTWTLPAGTLGYEWDVEQDNGYRPAGLVDLSTSTYNLTTDYLLDYGGLYGAGTATHHLTLYRYYANLGQPNQTRLGLVFGAGTVQWSWGLDATHDSSIGTAADPNMQQATVNLFADMGIQPATLQSGLVPATASTDTSAPTSTITSPKPSTAVNAGSTVTITGTAADNGGVVGGVEVSTDGGATWHPAVGRETWSYVWNVASGTSSATLMSRAVDDSGNIELPSPGVTVTLATRACPCSIWSSSTTPATTDAGPDSPVELGVKFASDVSGTISGIRFYKSSSNTGTHVGNLWTSSGTLLASATFTNETASGWQQVNFPTPVSITANTVYVASYHTTAGHYSDDQNYFANSGVDNAPLHALQNGVSGFDGVFAYGSTSTFPSQGYNSSNYWVDVVFGPASTLNSISVTPANPTVAAGSTQQFTAVGSYSNGSTQDISGQVTWSSSNSAVATISSSGLASAVAGGTTGITATQGTANGGSILTVQPTSLVITTSSLPNGTVGMAYSAAMSATGGTAPYTWSLASGTALPPGLSLSTSGQITGGPTAVGTTTFTVQVADGGNPQQTAVRQLSIAIAAVPAFYTIWNSTVTPNIVDSGPDSAVELGVQFRADVNGTITGLRFYKSSTNTGTHVGNLWTSAGALLASATFANETASGWQQVTFSTPVSITSNTVYVASYHTSAGHYSDDQNYFATSGIDSPPLHALQNGVSGFNGVFAYGTASAFPNQGYNSSNYWVDVMFSPSGSTGSGCSCNITGTISGSGGSGATVTLGGAASAVVTADTSGNYSFTGLPSGSYTIAAARTGFVFTPASQSVALLSSSVPGVNFTSTAQLAIDQAVSTDRSANGTNIVSPAFSTGKTNELLLAFIATGSTASNTTVTGVTGAGLTWSLVKRTNVQLGTAEIWRAFAPQVLSNGKVTATLNQSVAASITVVAFSGADTSGSGGSGAIGANGTGNATSGAPMATLTTTRNNSWVIGVGTDGSTATSRTLGAGQTMVHQFLTSTGKTFWVQRQTNTTPVFGTTVTVNDTAPTADLYNLSITEVLAAP